MALKWTEALSVGVKEIDSEHIELFDRFNKFLASMGPDKRDESLKETLGFLEDYVVKHFNHEEEFMDTYDYPKKDEHKALHADFKKKLNEIKTTLDTEGVGLGLIVETNRFLSNWLVNHISTIDKEFGAFLITKI
ncbi:MAG: hemerythrin family protein [Deltaproteobacteria bacterium]|nr:hemerythrin family protein [Deltaproteobacteria bacterium]